MDELRFFSIGCKVQVLETASECGLGGEVLEIVPVPEYMKGHVYIVDWLGRYGNSLRVVCKGVHMYFDKKDVRVVT